MIDASVTHTRERPEATEDIVEGNLSSSNPSSEEEENQRAEP